MTGSDKSRAPAISPPSGYDASRLNSLRHGVLSRWTVLPWEDEAEYAVLLQALVEEHVPNGPTEVHLVEELAGALWRKRRLRLAETATYHRGLHDTLKPHREVVKMALVHLGAEDQFESVIDALRKSTTETAEDLADLADDEATTSKALAILRSNRNDAYEQGLQALREDTQQWWQRELETDPEERPEDEDPPSADAAGLIGFLEEEVIPWFDVRKKELTNRPLIRQQAFGEALDPDKLERLGRYEVHLDRKVERTLSTLLRLQEIRKGRDKLGHPNISEKT